VLGATAVTCQALAKGGLMVGSTNLRAWLAAARSACDRVSEDEMGGCGAEFPQAARVRLRATSRPAGRSSDLVIE
jgi:hypothetical protein